MVSMLTAKSVAEICSKLNEKIGFSGFHFSFYSLILTKPSGPQRWPDTDGQLTLRWRISPVCLILVIVLRHRRVDFFYSVHLLSNMVKPSLLCSQFCDRVFF